MLGILSVLTFVSQVLSVCIPLGAKRVFSIGLAFLDQHRPLRWCVYCTVILPVIPGEAQPTIPGVLPETIVTDRAVLLI